MISRHSILEGTLQLYCEAVGIDYQDSMVDWRSLDEEQYMQFKNWLPWHILAVASTGFIPKTPSAHPDVKDLPNDVQNTIKENVPCYEQLYEKRLKAVKSNPALGHSGSTTTGSRR